MRDGAEITFYIPLLAPHRTVGRIATSRVITSVVSHFALSFSVAQFRYGYFDSLGYFIIFTGSIRTNFNQNCQLTRVNKGTRQQSPSSKARPARSRPVHQNANPKQLW